MEIMKKNHGTVKSTYPTNSEGKTVIMEPYGKDDSDVVGAARMERNPHSIGGSITNLSHSLTGVSANQKGS